jgi:cytochrome P450
MTKTSMGNQIVKLIKYLYRNSNGRYTEYSIGENKIVVLFSPESVYELFTKKSKNFNRGISFDNMKVAFDNEGILVSDDPKHIKDKKVMASSFHKNEIDKSCSVIYEVANHHLLKNKIGNIDILNLSQKYTFDSLSQCFFGKKIPKDLIEVINDTHNTVGNVETLNIKKEFFSEFHAMKNFFIDIIKNNNEDNLIKLMKDSGMDEKSVADQMLTILSAGFETTSDLISWSIFYLADNPDILKKLREEDNSWIKENRSPSLKDIEKSVMIKKIINETLRTKPPIYWTSRLAKSQVKISDIDIEKNTNVIVSQYISHFDPKYFKDPQRWNPERWVEGFEKSLPKGVYFPFGYGGTKCIGDQFGILLASIFILMFVNKYEFSNMGKFPKEGYMVSLFPTENTEIKILSML